MARVVGASTLGDAHFGSSIGRDGKLPVQHIAVSTPAALYETIGRAVGGIDMSETLWDAGLQAYVTVAAAVAGLTDARQILVVPDDEVAQEHDMVAGVHAWVGGVAVPQFPDGGGAVVGHESPTGWWRGYRLCRHAHSR